MTDDWDDGRGRSRRHRRSRRHWGRERQERAEREDPNLTAEESRYRQVRSIAERKTKLTGQAIRLGVIALVVLILTGSLWIAALVVLCWGGSRLREFYRLVLEPRIREKFIAKEVRNQVHATLSQERRALEGRHARSMEELSASIAHEIRNPITAAKSLVQQMGEDTSASENVEYAKVALGELDRVERSVSHLLRFARDEEMRMAPLRMAEVIESALESFGDRIDRAGIRLETRIDGEGALTGDWALSHAAFLGAQSEGVGPRFMLEVFRKRFCEGLDLGEDHVIADAASEAELDPDSILSAGHSEALREVASAGWRLAMERDQIFGVPSFVFAGKLYWGQDRMHFLRSAVIRKTGTVQ